MSIREVVESRAREAAMKIAKGYIHRDDHYPPRYNVDEIANEIAEELKRDLSAILTDPQIGFKEALEHIMSIDCGCPDYPGNACACLCHTAKAKLKELEELSK